VHRSLEAGDGNTQEIRKAAMLHIAPGRAVCSDAAACCLHAERERGA